MKKILTLLFIACTLVSFGQNTQGESVVTVDVGYSLAGNFIKNFIDLADDDAEVETSLTPVIMVGFDHALTDVFSIGIQGAYQGIGADFQHEYNDGGTLVTENVETTINRINVAIRPNFHYGGSENLDMYSGMRIGLQSFGTTHNSKDPDFSALNDLDNSRLSVGATLFGFRYFVTENFGMNMELGVGVPYAVLAGINFKF
ncbi:MAG: hypothetical protein KJP21_00110 [Bacteroidia bacterium]|nr:hypothetical protein [Bacteroidia bacterium]NNJ56016.1 hypothetical protein [Bacteroidia bacterium]